MRGRLCHLWSSRTGSLAAAKVASRKVHERFANTYSLVDFGEFY